MSRIITLSRKKQLTDQLVTYKVHIDGKVINLKSNETIKISNDITKNEEINLTIKHLWLKSRTVNLLPNNDYRIQVYGFLSNKQVYLMLSCLLLCQVISFTPLSNYDAYYEITSGVYLSFIFMMLYKITFGKNDYINLEFK